MNERTRLRIWEAKEGPIYEKWVLSTLMISMGSLVIVSSVSSWLIFVDLDSLQISLLIPDQVFFMFLQFSLKNALQ